MLWLGLGLLLWLNFQAWTKDHAAVVKETPAAQASTANSRPPRARRTDSPPNCQSVTGEATPAAQPTAVPGTMSAAIAGAAKVRIVTDVLDMDASLSGGELIRADITQYPLHKNDPKTPVRLLQHGFAGDTVPVPVGPDDGEAGAQRAEPQGAVHERRVQNTSWRRAAMRSKCRSPGRTEPGSR